MAVNLGSFVDKNNLKIIWTKVVNKIKSEINNIDIGGRNYIIYGRISSYEPYNVVNGRSINYIKTTWKSSYTGNTFTIKVDGFTPSKGIWTVSGRIKVNGSIPTTKYFTSSANTYGSLVTKCDYDTTTGRFVITQTYPGNSAWILHCPTTRSSGSSDVVELFDLKFEKGNKATDWSLSPEDLDNNISLIRPNLLSGTKDWKYGKTNGTIQSDKYYNLSVLYYKNTSSTSSVDIALWSGLSVKTSTEYTLSFYAKGTGKIYSYFHPNTVQIGYSNKGITTTSQDGSIHHVLTSGWEKYVITWKTLSTISGNKNVLPIRAYIGTEVWVCGVKFEEGNGATAWCESSSETAIPKYSVATPTSNGLMSSSDKNKLDMFGNGYVTAGALSTINDGTIGIAATGEGVGTGPIGDYSHAEGHEARAIGYASHAEGGVRYLLQGVNRYMIEDKFASSGGEEIIPMTVSYTVETNTSNQQKEYEVYAPAAVGTASHAEGVVSVASGIGSHSEGYRTMASGNYSHAEGSMAFANGDYSHAEGWGFTFCSIASGVASHVEGIETNANGEASHAEGFRTYADGDYSHAEGNESIAYKRYSHAEGIKTTANGEASHSEGNGTIADGDYSHAEGYKSVANGIASHAEGYSTRANGDHSHSEGIQTEASGIYSHAEGNNTHSKGANSHAEGAYTSASGNCSHSQGSYSSAVGSHSFSSGYCVSAANDYQTVLGKYNKTTSLSLFTIGNGTSTTDNSANAFRVDSNGYAYGKSFNTSGADYAEFFEWKDQNIQDEDRCGLFVTLDGEYIRIANSNDKYILGVVSANPSVLGDAYNGDNWNGIYEKDVFGRIQYHTVHIEEEKDENGVIIMEARDEVQPIISKNYNNQKAYYSREERTEWEPIGLLGKLIIIDDGTCEVNGYCKVADGGIGTKDDSETCYRVLSRLDENHIKILFR